MWLCGEKWNTQIAVEKNETRTGKKKKIKIKMCEWLKIKKS